MSGVQHRHAASHYRVSTLVASGSPSVQSVTTLGRFRNWHQQVQAVCTLQEVRVSLLSRTPGLSIRRSGALRGVIPSWNTPECLDFGGRTRSGTYEEGGRRDPDDGDCAPLKRRYIPEGCLSSSCPSKCCRKLAAASWISCKAVCVVYSIVEYFHVYSCLLLLRTCSRSQFHDPPTLPLSEKRCSKRVRGDLWHYRLPWKGAKGRIVCVESSLERASASSGTSHSACHSPEVSVCRWRPSCAAAAATWGDRSRARLTGDCRSTNAPAGEWFSSVLPDRCRPRHCLSCTVRTAHAGRPVLGPAHLGTRGSFPLVSV
jgi:hypothetical protein